MIELITTDGIFALDGGEWEVTNNIWLVGDDREVLVVDAAHDRRGRSPTAVNGRRVAVHRPHAWSQRPHQRRGGAAGAVDAPILLHPDDAMLWSVVYPDRSTRRRRWQRATRSRPEGWSWACCTRPATAPVAVACTRRSPAEAGAPVVFSGDTLFCGGPGATGRCSQRLPDDHPSRSARSC